MRGEKQSQHQILVMAKCKLKTVCFLGTNGHDICPGHVLRSLRGHDPCYDRSFTPSCFDMVVIYISIIVIMVAVPTIVAARHEKYHTSLPLLPAPIPKCTTTPVYLLARPTQYLRSPEIEKAAGGFAKGGTTPMYLGRRFRPNGDDDRIFNSGGAAYVLNQASLSMLASHLDDADCEPHRKCSWEDVQVGALSP